MAIVIGASGGSGDGVPTGSIITTGKDMTEEGWGKLDTPLVLDKENEPKLWEIYKEKAGDWSETDNNLSNEVNIYRWGNDFFVKIIDHDPFTMVVFKEFDGSDAVSFTLPITGATAGNKYTFYKGAIENQAVFFGLNFMYLVDFDSNAATAADFAASVTTKSWDVTGVNPNTVYITNTGKIYGIGTLSMTRIYYTDSRWGDNSSIDTIDLTVFPGNSDNIAEKFITINGFYCTRGIVCNLETMQQKTIEVDDHGQAFIVFHRDGKDYYSYNGFLGIIDADFEVEIPVVSGIGNNDVADYIDENNTLLSSTFTVFNGKTENGVYSSVTQRNILTDANVGASDDEKIQYTNLFNGGRICYDSETSVAYFMQFLSESPDIFTIDSVDSISTDKTAWIKLEQKGQ